MMIIFENIMEFFFDKIGGKVLLAAALVTSLIGWFAYQQRSIGARNVIAKIEQRTSENVAKANRARASIANTPADKLSDRYRRD